MRASRGRVALRRGMARARRTRGVVVVGVGGVCGAGAKPAQPAQPACHPPSATHCRHRHAHGALTTHRGVHRGGGQVLCMRGHAARRVRQTTQTQPAQAGVWRHTTPPRVCRARSAPRTSGGAHVRVPVPVPVHVRVHVPVPVPVHVRVPVHATPRGGGECRAWRSVRGGAAQVPQCVCTHAPA